MLANSFIKEHSDFSKQGSLRIFGNTFESCVCESDGGSIFIGSSLLKAWVSQCSFSHCIGAYGGCICSHCYVTLQCSSFFANEAKNYGSTFNSKKSMFASMLSMYDNYAKESTYIFYGQQSEAKNINASKTRVWYDLSCFTTHCSNLIQKYTSFYNCSSINNYALFFYQGYANLSFSNFIEIKCERINSVFFLFGNGCQCFISNCIIYDSKFNKAVAFYDQKENTVKIDNCNYNTDEQDFANCETSNIYFKSTKTYIIIFSDATCMRIHQTSKPCTKSSNTLLLTTFITFITKE